MTEKRAEGTKKFTDNAKREREAQERSAGTIGWTANEEGDIEDLTLVEEEDDNNG